MAQAILNTIIQTMTAHLITAVVATSPEADLPTVGDHPIPVHRTAVLTTVHHPPQTTNTMYWLIIPSVFIAAFAYVIYVVMTSDLYIDEGKGGRRG